MNKVAVYHKQTGSESQAKDSNLLWRRIPLLQGDVIGGRRTLVLFRYISWFLTSLFYLTDTVGFSVIFKFVVVLALLAAAWVAVRLYDKSKGNPANIIGIIIADTLFSTALLIPTGGLESPFMWYALNPIFMAISLLPDLYCLGVLGFLLTAIVVSGIYRGNTFPLFISLRYDSLSSLMFLLLTTAALLFARLARQLSGAYEKLADAHSSTERLLEQISNLYQALESFSSREEPRHLAALLAAYAKKLTVSEAGICYLFYDQYQPILEVSDDDGLFSCLRQVDLDTVFQRLKEGEAKVFIFPVDQVKDRYLICVPVQSPGARFGLLGYIFFPGQAKQGDEERAIAFLAELGAIILERRKADDMAARLLVAEEQNRIANEIHDGVSQQLFSIVYALHTLSQKQGELQDYQVQQQLNLIKETASQTARDLRASIYRISPRKRGEQVFVAGISTYLEDLAKLNEIKVDLQAEGSEETLSPALRKALYRIIREATSNAIRHGKCKNIKVILKMALEKVLLQVVDDGEGFDINNRRKEGLGIENMRSLITSFNGLFRMESDTGSGTRLTCMVPDKEDN